MTDFLYLTADQIGAETGGGLVTKHEALALTDLAQSLGLQAQAWSFPGAPRPWGSDEQAVAMLRERPDFKPRLAHIYAGCFTETVRELHRRGCKVAYTVAAHDRHVSREEHEKLGLPFDYPHLVDPEQFARYSAGYREADVVVAPGEAPRRVLERDGVAPERIRIIPHGCTPPSEIAPLPRRFAVGYLGSPGVDKGLRYLLEAWKLLDYKDAMLTIAGPGTENLSSWVRAFGGGNVYLRGPVKSPSLLYNSISLYVNPAATTGFDLGVLEAQAHGRPVICSRGAGASDHATATVAARDTAALAEMIDKHRKNPIAPNDVGGFAWPRIRERYKAVWREAMHVS